MSLSFDDYHRLLGIEVDQVPPTHYQLLGLQQFENSQKLILAAVMRSDSRLRAVMQGADVASAQRMLNLIAAARICLTDESAKFNYDESLKARSRVASHVDQSSSLRGFSNAGEVASIEVDTARIGSSAVAYDAEPEDDAMTLKTKTLIEIKAPASTVRSAQSQSEQHRFRPAVALISFLLIATFTIVLIVQAKFGSPGSESKSSDSIDIQQDHRNANSITTNNYHGTKQRRVREPRKQKSQNGGLDDVVQLANTAEGVVNFDVLPFSDGLCFWLDANDEKTLETDGQGTVYCWMEKISKHRSTSRSDFPKRTAVASGKSAIAFDGNVGFCFNRFIEFAPKEFTIVYIANGTGVLLAKGDPHLEPEAAFAIDGKSEMRFRTASRKYLFVKNSSARQFAPRAILVSRSSVRLLNPNGEPVERDRVLQLNNQHPISIGMLQSGDSNRVKKNLFQGKIGEIMIFNRALNDADAKDMMKYLFVKWLGVQSL